LHLLLFHFSPIAADLVILTINARKITSAEEHITNTIWTTYYRLFSMMGTNGTDIETGIATANPHLSL